jgi:hypothetical protein
MGRPPQSYRDAGVDIERGNALVERIKPLAQGTVRAGVMGGVGGCGALVRLAGLGYRDPILVSSTDGVGTKQKLAIALDGHDTIGIDLVAMCANEVVVQGAEPLFFLDYFATGRLDVEVATRVIAGIAADCKQAGAALVGGETAEMPDLYAAADYDLAGFCVGVAEGTLAETLLLPTRIYVRPILDLIGQIPVQRSRISPAAGSTRTSRGCCRPPPAPSSTRAPGPARRSSIGSRTRVPSPGARCTAPSTAASAWWRWSPSPTRRGPSARCPARARSSAGSAPSRHGEHLMIEGLDVVW